MSSFATLPPVNIDIIALVIFLGIVQGLLLAAFFFSKNNRVQRSNIYMGFVLFSVSLLATDVWLSHTNLMFRVIFLLDGTEPLNLVVSPLLYLYVLSKLDESMRPKLWPHFMPALIILVYNLVFNVATDIQRYDAYIGSYHPEMMRIGPDGPIFSDPLYLKRFINELTMVSIIVYTSLSGITLFRFTRNQTHHPNRLRLFKLLRSFIIGFTVLAIIFIYVKATHFKDMGDYIIVLGITFYIYNLSFKIIKDSTFFSRSQYEPKYAKSSLSPEMRKRLLEKITTIIEEEEYFLNPNASLPELSKKVNASSNHVSQIVNEELGMGFIDLLSKYRISRGCEMLKAANHTTDTIENIAYSVGYNSKSSFNTAFKKRMGMTPSEYRTNPKD